MHLTTPKEETRVPAPAGEKRQAARVFVGVFVFLLLVVHALDQLMVAWAEAAPLAPRWGLDGREFFRGRWWAPLSYPLVHLGPLHLALNAGALALFGHALSETWSWGRLALLTLLSALGGAGLWLTLHHGQRNLVIGSSAIVCGYVSAFVLERPAARLPLPGLPWGFPRWVLLILLLGLEGRGLWQEAGNRPSPGALSHSAHLGGALAAAMLESIRRIARRRSAAA